MEQTAALALSSEAQSTIETALVALADVALEARDALVAELRRDDSWLVKAFSAYQPNTALPKPKDRTSYDGPRAVVGSTKITPLEATIIRTYNDKVADWSDGFVPAKLLVSDSVSINQISGAISMLLAKGFVITEKRNDAAHRIKGRFLLVTPEGSAALATATAAKAEKPKTPAPQKMTETKPSWTTKLTVADVIDTMDINGDTGDELEELAGPNYRNGKGVKLSTIWERLSHNATTDIEKARGTAS